MHLNFQSIRRFLHKTTMAVGIAVVAIAMISVVFICFIFFACFLNLLDIIFDDNPFDDAKFNPTVWNEMKGSEDSTNPRGPMAEDIRKHHIKLGMTRDEVVNLLGEPDFAKDFNKDSRCYSYMLGMWSGLRFLDYDSIDICFDQSGRVEATSIIQH